LFRAVRQLHAIRHHFTNICRIVRTIVIFSHRSKL
jgi:hypothetical protein